jgi:hypothetical protein
LSVESSIKKKVLKDARERIEMCLSMDRAAEKITAEYLKVI